MDQVREVVCSLEAAVLGSCDEAGEGEDCRLAMGIIESSTRHFLILASYITVSSIRCVEPCDFSDFISALLINRMNTGIADYVSLFNVDENTIIKIQ